MKKLNDKLAEIQTELIVKKSSYNSFGKYYFRKAEDILEAIKPFLLKHGVTVTINEELIMTDPVPTIKSIATITDGKDSVNATAVVGVDLNQKGMQTAQQFGAASSYGKKYSLGNLFLIDDTADADTTNSHGKSNAVACMAFSPSDIVAVDFIVGTGSVIINSSLIVTVTPCSIKKGFIASKMSSDLRK